MGYPAVLGKYITSPCAFYPGQITSVLSYISKPYVMLFRGLIEVYSQHSQIKSRVYRKLVKYLQQMNLLI